MYNNKHSKSLINNFVEIRRQHHEFISRHHDQLREHAFEFSNTYLDQSISFLKDIHAKISHEGSDSKIEISAALIQTLIDNASHFKATMSHRKQGVNTHKQNLRRLAMGVMAGFGLMSTSQAASHFSDSDSSKGWTSGGSAYGSFSPVPSRSDSVSSDSEAVAAANLDRYVEHSEALKEGWKIAASIKDDPQSAEYNSQSFFFESGAENSELTAQAILQLQYDFLIEHPEINIPDIENFGLFTLARYDKSTHAVKIETEQMKQKLLNQSLAAFSSGQKLYASIVQMGGAGSGHYTLVVIENDGAVHMINTMGAYPGAKELDPYAFIMPELVKSLNTHKGASSVEFRAGSNVRTGIQDADIGSSSCGLYSFTYWAALMITQDINAYKRVTAAAADGYLGDYDDILSAANHKNAIDTIIQVEDLSKANDFGIRYLKNPQDAVQQKYERELRDRLQLKLADLSS